MSFSSNGEGYALTSWLPSFPKKHWEGPLPISEKKKVPEYDTGNVTLLAYTLPESRASQGIACSLLLNFIVPHMFPKCLAKAPEVDH